MGKVKRSSSTFFFIGLCMWLSGIIYAGVFDPEHGIGVHGVFEGILLLIATIGGVIALFAGAWWLSTRKELI